MFVLGREQWSPIRSCICLWLLIPQISYSCFVLDTAKIRQLDELCSLSIYRLLMNYPVFEEKSNKYLKFWIVKQKIILLIILIYKITSPYYKNFITLIHIFFDFFHHIFVRWNVMTTIFWGERTLAGFVQFLAGFGIQVSGSQNKITDICHRKSGKNVLNLKEGTPSVKYVLSPVNLKLTEKYILKYRGFHEKTCVH